MRGLQEMLHRVLLSSGIFHHNSSQSLWILNVHRLHVTVQLLLGTFLVISFPRYPHAQSVWHTFDARLPNLLIELRVEADVFSSLGVRQACQ